MQYLEEDTGVKPNMREFKIAIRLTAISNNTTNE